MDQSEHLDQLGAALAAASAQLRDVEHDAKNPHLRNRYATLSAVLTTARPILTANGLSLTQWLGGDIAERERVTVTTQLLHVSGQWMRSTVGAVVERGKGLSIAQSGGSSVSYLRRYAALAALGISSADDVDGHLPQYDGGREPPPQKRNGAPKTQAPAASVQKWNDTERKAFCAMLTGWGLRYEDVAAWCESKGKPRPSVMQRDTRAKLLGWLERMESSDARLAAVGVTP